MGAIVSLDGFMADDNDVAWSFPGSDDECRTTQASADFILDVYGDMAANVIGRRVFDMTNGWNGKPAAGQIGGQALRLGMFDQVVVNQVPAVFGSGRPFFATGGLAEPLRLEDPTTIVRGDRVTHLVYDVSR